MTANTGGSAFPRPYSQFALNDHDDIRQSMWDQEGMSMRDWFAGMALQGLMAENATLPYQDRRSFMAMAFEAYQMADAMIAERRREED